ncbi:translation initiation factor IF-3 [Buchnera aphidicola]|uniref:Translation initiation factor IF-3 n=1 Tax=Buchnera aphidicola (Stegophylla sp.) TaxID=2315800 RepID=A0A4D6YK14_9GAMM|nr:translation initiation factor IF-3 [Buchnera aphidicola (Stegophylla sp.)]QCI26274.1 translation initiation factor IF-3 [Buchnera aphidicola (Stegophylla sp.)]
MKIGNRMQLVKPNRINNEIKVKKIRLIGINNELFGIMTIQEALRYAESSGADLVEISPHAKPPVCRIMNYGKFLYKKNKNLKEQKKKQKIVQIKEIKLRPGTEESDYQVKLRNLIKFLKQGNKVKVTLRFRGREMAHQDIGIQVLKRIQHDLVEFSILESFPSKIEGRQMIMILNPKKK